MSVCLNSTCLLFISCCIMQNLHHHMYVSISICGISTNASQLNFLCHLYYTPYKAMNPFHVRCKSESTALLGVLQVLYTKCTKGNCWPTKGNCWPILVRNPTDFRSSMLALEWRLSSWGILIFNHIDLGEPWYTM